MATRTKKRNQIRKGPHGGMQVVLSASTGADSAVVRALWPYLRAEVRHRGGGGNQSAQRALAQVTG